MYGRCSQGLDKLCVHNKHISYWFSVVASLTSCLDFDATMPTGTKSGCFGGYSHLLVVVSLFGLLIGMQNLLLYQKMRWALHVAEKTHMFVISSFYYDVSKR